MDGTMEVRLPGRKGTWIKIDVVVGDEEHETWNRQPLVVILDEGFDGLRFAFWGTNDEDVDEAVADGCNKATIDRWQEASENRGWHFFGRAAEHRIV